MIPFGHIPDLISASKSHNGGSLCQALRWYSGNVLKRAKRKYDAHDLEKGTVAAGKMGESRPVSPQPPRVFRISFY